jgi:hypothetical protein
MRLPNGDRADLGAKLTEYALNPAHRDGKHKARVFESVLGINLSNHHILAKAILTAGDILDSAELKGNNGHGNVYVLRFPLQTGKGSAVIMTSWIIRDGEDFPRLTTC